MLGLSSGEVVLVGMIVSLIFGWTWVPRLAERIGALFSGVKQGMREDDERIVVRQASGESRDDHDHDHDDDHDHDHDHDHDDERRD